MTCTDLRGRTLLGWWLGELEAGEAADAEEHLFACERCTDDLERLEALAAGTRALLRAGRFDRAVLPSLVDRLARDGLRIRTFRIRAGERVPCGAAPDDDLLLARLDVPLEGVTRLDCETVHEPTGDAWRVEDLPFDAARGAVLLAERAARGRRSPAGPLRMTLFGTRDDGGGPRELGTWTLVHDPAGPPADGGP